MAYDRIIGITPHRIPLCEDTGEAQGAVQATATASAKALR